MLTEITRLRATISTPIGRLTISANEAGVLAINTGTSAEVSTTSPLLGEACAQLTAYFDGRLTHFDLPVSPEGPPRQCEIWRAMCEIPYGTTSTYGEFADSIASSARAVGGACARNPLPIIVPCHRVLPKSGGVGDYSFAAGAKTKLYLLKLEGASIPAGTASSSDGQIAMPI